MKTYFLTVLALIVFSFAKAQTVDEIIAKHTDALGGKDKLLQIKSLYTESSISVSGMSGLTKTSVVNGKGYRSESDLGGQVIVQAVNDKGGWQINPFMGSTAATAMSDDEYQLMADNLNIVDPLANYATNGAKVELEGQEKVGDVNAFKIKYTNKYNKSTELYIDPTTWFLIKSVTTATIMGQSITTTGSYSNYQKTDYGIFMPYNLSVDTGQFTLAFTVTKVEVNGTIDPIIFDMPK